MIYYRRPKPPRGLFLFRSTDGKRHNDQQPNIKTRNFDRYLLSIYRRNSDANTRSPARSQTVDQIHRLVMAAGASEINRAAFAK